MGFYLKYTELQQDMSRDAEKYGDSEGEMPYE